MRSAFAMSHWKRGPYQKGRFCRNDQNTAWLVVVGGGGESPHKNLIKQRAHWPHTAWRENNDMEWWLFWFERHQNGRISC